MKRYTCVAMALALAAGIMAGRVQAGNLWWDSNSAGVGAGTTPNGTWGTSTFWSSDPAGLAATAAYTAGSDDYFSAGSDATGPFTITLTTAQTANSLTFEEGSVTISGAGGTITLGGSGNVTVNSGAAAIIGNNTTTVIGGAASLSKYGLGTLTLNGSAVNTFTGGLKLYSGTLVLDYANLAVANLVNSGNAPTFGGGALLVKGNSSGTTAQTLGNAALGTGGASSVLLDPNGGTSTTLTLGTLPNAVGNASGPYVLFGKTTGAGAGTATITTTSATYANGIYQPRAYLYTTDGGTTVDWAATASGVSPYTLSGYSAYVVLPIVTGSSTVNYRMTAGTTLTGNVSTYALKFENPSGDLAIGSNNLLVYGDGILATGATPFNITGSSGVISGSSFLNAWDLVFHQYNTGGMTISAIIANSGANNNLLTKNGPGRLTLSGVNTYSGATTVNAGTLQATKAAALPSAVYGGRTTTVYPAAMLAVNAGGAGEWSAAEIANYVLNNANTTFASGTSFGIDTGSGDFTFSSAIPPKANLALTKLGANTLTLNGWNLHSGNTLISAGTLQVGNNGALWNSPLDTSGSGTLAFSSGVNTPTFGGLIGAASLTMPANVTALALNPDSGVAASYSGALGSATAGMTLTKIGAGTQILSGVNTFTGALNVNAGVLMLDYAGAASVINGGNALNMGGGLLYIKGKSSGTTAQTLGTVTLNPGGGQVLVDAFGGAGTTLTLGSLNAGTAGSSLLIGQSGAGSVAITTTGNKDSQNIYGGRVVYTTDGGNTVDWATTASGSSPYTLSAYGTYTTMLLPALVDTANDLTAAGTTTLSGSQTHNSLKMISGTTVALGANNLVLASGGLLSVGTAASTISGTGYLTAGYNLAGAFDLVIHQYNAGGLTIAAVVADNGSNPTSLTKSGPQTLVLSGANAYSGGTYLAAGTLYLQNAAALGNAAGKITINGGTLNANNQSIGSNPQDWNGDFTYSGANGSLTFGSGAVTMNGNRTVTVSANTFTVGGRIGDGGGGFGLIKAGAGTLVLPGANTYTGLTTVNAGALTLSGANTGNGGFTLNAGTLNINNAGALGSGTLTINGGTINNSSGSAITLSTVTPQSWAANFTFTGSANLNLGTGPVTLNGTAGQRLVTISGGVLTVGGIISNGTASGLIKKGNGVMILNGANTYSGETSFNWPGGWGDNVIRADNGVGLPTASLLTIGDAGIFETSQNLTRVGGSSAGNMRIQTIVGSANGGFSAYGGNPTITFATSGVDPTPIQLAWNGTGGFLNSGSTLLLNSALANGTLTFANPISMAASQTVEVRAGTAIMSGVISGAGGLTKGNTSGLNYTGGTLVLSGNNSFAGQLVIAIGTLSIPTINDSSANGPLGNSASSVLLANGTTFKYTGADATPSSTKKFSISAGGTATFHVDNAGTTLTLSGAIDGVGSYLTKSGAGTLRLSGPNTYSGDTIVSAGTLTLADQNTLQNSTVYLTGGGIVFDSSVGGNAFTLGGLKGWSSLALVNNAAGAIALTVGGNNQSTSYGGSMSGGGSLGKTGTGTLTLYGASTYSGGTTINGGILQFKNAAAMPNYVTATVTVGAAGTLAINGGLASPAEWSSAEIDALLANGNLTFAAGGTFGIDTTSASFTYGTAVTKANMGLAKLGPNTLTLNGSIVNSYTGATSITGGTLALDFANLGTPTDLINSASTLTLAGGTLTIKGNASGSTSQTLGSVTMNAGGSQILVDPNGGAGTTLNLGTLAAGSTGGTLLAGKAAGAGGGSVTITTTSAADATGIYGGRIVFTPDGGTTVNWAASTGGGPYTLGAYSGYAAMVAGFTSDTLNDTTGTLTLSGAHTHNSLQITSGATLALGANLLTLTSGGLLSVGSIASTVSGSANPGLKGSASGDLIIQQYNTGGLTISAIIGNNGGATALTKSGPGTLTLSGANTFTGGIVVNNGMLSFGSTSYLNGNSITLNGGGLTYTGGNGANYPLITVGPNGGYLYALTGWASSWGGITGSGNLYFYSAKDERFSVAAGYAISGDFVVMQNDGGIFMGSFPNATVDIQTASGITRGNNYQTYPVFGGLKGSGPLTLSNFGSLLSIGNNNKDTTYTGIISGATPWAKIGSGTLTMTNNANTFTGSLTIQSGKIAIGSVNSNNAAGPLGQSANAVTLGYTNGISGTLRLIGTSPSYSSDKSFVLATGGTGVFQVDNAGTTQKLSGAISGGGALTKTGAGVLMISGTNTFSGPLTVYAGTLGGFYGSTTGALTSKTGATLSPGLGAAAMGVFANGGHAVLETGGTLVIDVGQASGDCLSVGGSASLDGSLTFVTNAPLMAQSYTIVSSAGARSGVFAVTNDLPAGYSVVYGANSVQLVRDPSPIINVLGTNSVLITMGNSSPSLAPGTDFGYGAVGTAWTNTFVVTNVGANTLTLTGTPAVQFTGHSDFSVSSQPGTTVASGNKVSFSIVFTPTANLSRTGTVSIASDDAAHSPYTFALRGGPLNGIWTNDASGNWSGITNWLENAVPQGAGYTSSFVTNITAARTVTNNLSNLSIGNLNFEDTAASHDWTLTGNQITLDNAGKGSTIYVSNRTATVSCVLAGAETLTKSGAGTLSLTVANTYVGKTVINGGTVILANQSTVFGPIPGTMQADNVTVDGATIDGSVDSLGDKRGLMIGPNGCTFSSSFYCWVGPVSGTGPLTIKCGGFRLNGAGGGGQGAYDNDYTGDTIIAAGGSVVPFRTLSMQYSTLDLTYQANGLTSWNGQANPVLGGLKGTQNWAIPAPASGSVYIGNNNKDTTYTGALSGSTPIIKIGTGALTLTGANTYTGTTTVNGGTLTLAAANGAIASSTGVAISGGGTLKLDNMTNNVNRVGNAVPITMNGGTFIFTNNAAPGVNYSETVGALTNAVGANVISVAQAAVGQTSTLTLSSLTRTAGTLNFAGTGLGDGTGRCKILITGQADGPIGSWATVNGSDLAWYDATGGTGVMAYASSSYTDIDARGGGSNPNINDGAASNVRIQSDGVSGAIGLGAATVTIGSLLQNNASYPTVVDTAAKTLRVGTVTIGTGKSDLTLGAAANNGALTAAAAGGELILNNNSTATLTVNAVIADNTSSSALNKGGAGTLVLSGTNSFSGAFSIGGGIVKLGAAGNGTSSPLGTTAMGTTVLAGGSLDLNGYTLSTAEPVTLNGTGVSNVGALVNSSAAPVTWSGAITLGSASRINSAGGLLTLDVLVGDAIGGAGQNLMLGGSGDIRLKDPIGTTTGSVTKDGAGTVTFGVLNTYSGGTTVSNGTLWVNNPTGSGTGSGGVSAKTNATLGGGGSIAGVVTVENGGHLAPGSNTVGTLTLSAANAGLTFNSGAVLDCQIGGTTASPSNDLVNLTGTSSTISFGGTAVLNLYKAVGSTIDPTGKTFVLFDYTGSNPTLPAWTINYGSSGWWGGTVSVDSANTRIVLTGMQLTPPPTGTTYSFR